MNHVAMIEGLTSPYGRGACVVPVPLGADIRPGLTAVAAYGFDDYAARFGVELWDIRPMYVVAPLFTLAEPVCLSIRTLGAAPDKPWPRVHVPAGTAPGVSFAIPLGPDVSGVTQLDRIHEWPAPEGAGPGRERWAVHAVIGNLGRLLWVLGGERASLSGLVADVAAQHRLTAARGRSLDLIGADLRVPRLPPAAYPVDLATVGLYHLDDLPTEDEAAGPAETRVRDETGANDGLRDGALTGRPGRFRHAFEFRSGDLPAPRCAAEHTFQQVLRSGEWDAADGSRLVRSGPYRRYGYREGAIAVPGPDGRPHPVWVNDEARDPATRGLISTACHGFVPRDLDRAIAVLTDRGQPVRQAIDYFGDWWGLSEQWYATTYRKYGVTEPYERCPLPDAATTLVRIPNAAPLAVPADRSFTVEAFIRPVPTTDDRLRVIAIKSRDIFYGGRLRVHCLEGWALSIGRYNCVPNNLAWSISDLADGPADWETPGIATVFADLDLGDGAWHHVAGVIDRHRSSIRLYVDGIERGCRHVAGLGALENQEDIIIGNVDYRFDAPYDGLIDEVRLSDVARRGFHPVLGESDHRYRTRLGIYRRWVAPTMPELTEGLRRLLRVSPYDPEAPAPPVPEIRLDERPGTRICTERRFPVRPLSLPSGGHIDLLGNRERSEDEACGRRDTDFAEWQLIRHDDPRIVYATEAARRMQLAAARATERLAELVMPAIRAGRLQVVAAYEPGVDPRASVGRVIMVRGGPSLPAGALAAFAHKAGFDHVHRDGDVVRAAVREEIEKLDVVTTDEAEAGTWPARNAVLDVTVGDRIEFTVGRPDLSGAAGPASVTFDVMPPFRARLTEHVGTGIAFVPLAPGTIIVRADAAGISGTRTVRVLPRTVGPCQSIAADGTMGLPEPAVDDSFFDVAALIDHRDARIEYAAGTSLMQAGLGRTLDVLLALVDREPEFTGRLQILAGFNESADDFSRVGRRLVIGSTDTAHLSLSRLAALAHAAGFVWAGHPPYLEGIVVVGGPGGMFEITAGPIELLAPNAVVNWLGLMRADVPEAPVLDDVLFDATDPANIFRDPADRVVFDVPAADRMTPATQAVLARLLDLLDAEAPAGQLHVLAAFDDKAPDRRKAGRAVRLRHDTVRLDRLGALAHRAAFDYVKHVTVPAEAGSRYVYASVWRGEDLSEASPEELPELVDLGLVESGSELAENASALLRIQPAVRPGDSTYEWCVVRYGPGDGRLDTPAAEGKLITALHPGVIGARASLVLHDGADPYRFEVRLDGAQPIAKATYDDLLNFLDVHLPVGVEARTADLREHVAEIAGDRATGTTSTFPRYRAAGRKALPPSISAPPDIDCSCPLWPMDEPEEGISYE